MIISLSAIDAGGKGLQVEALVKHLRGRGVECESMHFPHYNSVTGSVFMAVLPQPRLQILLDIPVEESFRRRPQRDAAYEADRGRLEKVREHYWEYFRRLDRDRWWSVDGTWSPEDVTREIVRKVDKMMEE